MACIQCAAHTCVQVACMHIFAIRTHEVSKCIIKSNVTLTSRAYTKLMPKKCLYQEIMTHNQVVKKHLDRYIYSQFLEASYCNFVMAICISADRRDFCNLWLMLVSDCHLQRYCNEIRKTKKLNKPVFG